MTDTSRSIDQVAARNNTLITMSLNGKRVGRIQQFREDQSNNVQVLAELGRDVMVEMLRGIRSYSFTIASFYCHADVLDQLKDGAVFSIDLTDENAGVASEVLEHFSRCMIQSISRDYTVGQAAVGQNAQVVVIGAGVGVPTSS